MNRGIKRKGMRMQISLYCYRALVQSVYDGDTCTVDVDLGLKTWVRGEKLRLNRINTPELKGEEREAGLKARDFLRNLIDGKEVIIQTVADKEGKFGRYLAEIWVVNSDGSWLNINDHLIKSGHAKYYKNQEKPLAIDLNEIS